MILPHLPPLYHATLCRATQSDPSLPSARFSSTELLRQSTTVPQHHRAAQADRFGWIAPPEPNATRGGFYPRQKMTWRIFSLLRIKGFLRGRKRIGGSCNKKGFSLGPTLLLGTDEADSDISLHPITIHH